MLKIISFTVLIVAIWKKKIGCVQSQDREARRINPHAIAERKK